MKAAGVCHSDLHIWEGSYDLGGGRRLMLKDRGIPLPLTMGHETAGEIISVGPNVTDRKVGEMVLVYPWIGCGVCRVCRDGYENLCMKPRCLGVHCDGGYADQIVVPNSKYLLPLDGLDPVSVAPYACSGVTTYSALKKLGSVIKEEPVLVIGAGGLGLMCVTILKAMGGKGAIVVDIDAKRRAAALEAGALAAVDGSRARRARAGRRGARRPRLGGDRSGRQPADRGARLRLARQGRQVHFGRLVRRLDALVAAADPDEGGDDRGQLHRQPRRDARIAGSRALRRDPENPDPHAPDERGDGDARRPQSRPHRRARRPDALIGLRDPEG